MAELREAAKSGDAARVEAALSAGADINFQDKFVRRPPPRASSLDGSAPDRPRRDTPPSCSPLCSGTCRAPSARPPHGGVLTGALRHAAIVRTLLKRGANASLKNTDGETAVDVAKGMVLANEIRNFKPTN